MASKDARAHQAGYVQTNDAAGNEVVVFDRSADGQLTPSGRLATGVAVPARLTSRRRPRSC